MDDDAGGEQDDPMVDDAGRPGGTPQARLRRGRPRRAPASSDPPSAEEAAMTEGPPAAAAESRLCELENLANEGLITPEEHERLRPPYPLDQRTAARDAGRTRY